ncbi:hypothetical protein [Streptomyces syringium]|uniref:hypothetical protein n=1 Tax=Streptomyces syringium TaxID=76729 RepID=UPI003422C268
MEIEVMRSPASVIDPVEFSSPAGNAWGAWKGRGYPSPGTYHVEFEIPEEITSWEPSGTTEGKIEGEWHGMARHVSISGVVENVDDDAVVSLRVGTDVVLVEMASCARTVHAGEAITFKTPALDLYPYQL